MIRNVGKKIKTRKFVEVEEVITKEKITVISINLDSKVMSVTIEMTNENDTVVDEKTVNLINEDYDSLFSSAPIFDDGKQEGSYREVDLWKMIDLVSNR